MLSNKGYTGEVYKCLSSGHTYDIYNDSNGYELIKIGKGYPNADKRGFILLHRYIFQEYNKYCLLPWTDIHHINGICNDNRIENLMPLHHSVHLSVTHRKNLDGRICLLCGTDKTDSNNRPSKRPIWHKYKDGFICRKCYIKIKQSTPEFREHRKIRRKRILAIQNSQMT
jgi:hypothetical protein